MSMDSDMDDEGKRYLTKLQTEWVPIEPSPPPAPSSSKDVGGRHADVSTLWPKYALDALTETDPDERDPRNWSCCWWPILEHLFPEDEEYEISEYVPPPAMQNTKPVEVIVRYRRHSDATSLERVAFIQVQPPQRLDDIMDRIRVDKMMRDRFLELFREEGTYESAVGLSALGTRIALYTSTYEVRIPTVAQQCATGAKPQNYLAITPHRSTQDGGGVCFRLEPGMLHDRCPKDFWATHVCSDEGYRMMERFRDHVRDSVEKHLGTPERTSPPNSGSMLVDDETGEDSRPESVTGADDMDES